MNAADSQLDDPDKTVVAPASPDDDQTVIDPHWLARATSPRSTGSATAPGSPGTHPAHATLGTSAPPPASLPDTPAPSRHPQTGTALALPPGFRLHEYRIDRVLGQGGFGITYLATDVNLNSRVAIKEYLPEEIAFRTSGKTVSAHSTRHRERYQNGLDSFLIEGRTLASGSVSACQDRAKTEVGRFFFRTANPFPVQAPLG